MAQKTISNVVTMKSAILEARARGNKGAIDEKLCEELNISSQALSQWEAWCEQLRESCVVYLDMVDDQVTDEKAIQRALNAVWTAWKALLKAGCEKDFDPAFFLRKVDVNRICHMCAERIYRSQVFNAQLIHQTKIEFRKNVETLIGIRLAKNGILSDEDRDVIVAYEQALRTVNSRTDALEGYKRGKNEMIGLRTQLLRAEANLKAADDFVKKYHLAESDAKAYKESFSERIDALKKEIDDAEKALDKAQKTVDKLQASYDDLKETINA